MGNKKSLVNYITEHVVYFMIYNFILQKRVKTFGVIKIKFTKI